MLASIFYTALAASSTLALPTQLAKRESPLEEGIALSGKTPENVGDFNTGVNDGRNDAYNAGYVTAQKTESIVDVLYKQFHALGHADGLASTLNASWTLPAVYYATPDPDLDKAAEGSASYKLGYTVGFDETIDGAKFAFFNEGFNEFVNRYSYVSYMMGYSEGVLASQATATSTRLGPSPLPTSVIARRLARAQALRRQSAKRQQAKP